MQMSTFQQLFHQNGIWHCKITNVILPMANHDFKKGTDYTVVENYSKRSHFQVKLQFENNSSNWIGAVLFILWIVQFDEFFKHNRKFENHSWIVRFDEFFKQNCNLKISCQIELVLPFLAEE